MFIYSSFSCSDFHALDSFLSGPFFLYYPSSCIGIWCCCCCTQCAHFSFILSISFSIYLFYIQQNSILSLYHTLSALLCVFFLPGYLFAHTLANISFWRRYTYKESNDFMHRKKKRLSFFFSLSRKRFREWVNNILLLQSKNVQ